MADVEDSNGAPAAYEVRLCRMIAPSHRNRPGAHGVLHPKLATKVASHAQDGGRAYIMVILVGLGPKAQIKLDSRVPAAQAELAEKHVQPAYLRSPRLCQGG